MPPRKKKAAVVDSNTEASGSETESVAEEPADDYNDAASRHGSDSDDVDVSDNDDEEEENDADEANEPIESNFNFVDETAYVHKMEGSVEVVKPDERRTKDMLTRAEISEIISIRADQISKNTIVFTDCTGLTDPIDMAKKEFNDRKTPLILQRRIGEKIVGGVMKEYVERWDVKTMTRPFVFDR
jgi:hypothetical protein